MKRTITLMAAMSCILLAKQVTPTPLEQSYRFLAEFMEASSEYNLDPYLLLAIGKTESGLDPTFVSGPQGSGTKSVGIMQISTGYPDKEDFEEHLLEPGYNIQIGAKILKQCMDMFGEDKWKAVGCYSGEKRNQKPDSQYVKTVKFFYESTPEK